MATRTGNSRSALDVGRKRILASLKGMSVEQVSQKAIPELADVVYRATFSYDPQRDVVSLWHSGARYTSRGYEWHAAFERRPRTDLFEAAARLPAAAAQPPNTPPLTNATAP